MRALRTMSNEVCEYTFDAMFKNLKKNTLGETPKKQKSRAQRPSDTPKGALVAMSWEIQCLKHSYRGYHYTQGEIRVKDSGSTFARDGLARLRRPVGPVSRRAAPSEWRPSPHVSENPLRPQNPRWVQRDATSHLSLRRKLECSCMRLTNTLIHAIISPEVTKMSSQATFVDNRPNMSPRCTLCGSPQSILPTGFRDEKTGAPTYRHACMTFGCQMNEICRNAGKGHTFYYGLFGSEKPCGRCGITPQDHS